MTTADAKQIVDTFFKDWNEDFSNIRQIMREACSDGFVWKNAGFPDAIGADQSADLLEGFCKALRLERIGIVIHRLIVDGDTVVTERRDDLINADGEVIAFMDVLGIFEVENGKIREWREYADPREVLDLAAKAQN